MRAILKESTANYISLESLVNVDFGKKYELPVFLTNELIGYQNSADFCEIWPEHSLDVVKQKCVRDF